MNTPSSHPESTNPGSTDNGLVEGIRAHDEQAWARFVDEYSPLVYVWCRHCDLQPADALDVSQQVFQAVSRSISTFTRRSGGGSFRGWLFIITRNLIRNYLTRTLRGPRPQGGTSIQIRLLQEPDLVDEESLSGTSSAVRDSSMQSALDAARAALTNAPGSAFGWLRWKGIPPLKLRSSSASPRCRSPSEISRLSTPTKRPERFFLAP